MKVKDVIKLLEKCNQEDDLELWAEESDTAIGFYLNNKIAVSCPECDGTGRKIYEHQSGSGYCSNGDYKDPTYTEYEDSCNICDGEGRVWKDTDADEEFLLTVVQK